MKLNGQCQQKKQANFGEGSKKIVTINMRNYKVRIFTDNVHIFIDIFVCEEQRKIALKECISHYKKLMHIMQKRGKLHR